eukprot:CAMPEP_0202955162 /NCGR_PEP_ID=MMETSP1395-20130829/51543_1 /ASSEMBLY_ACC=CAM_ASM_000871 /TAXON_ID=5961 /ORGANISM="Blepharisma japonicum, Strain Stock R1072" /LENGTH=74 /DNA_ID=CAMNT_0049671427 /DNA_START=694 /DNA_END=918 /DNA_ORIENTATION=+
MDMEIKLPVMVKAIMGSENIIIDQAMGLIDGQVEALIQAISSMGITMAGENIRDIMEKYMKESTKMMKKMDLEP